MGMGYKWRQRAIPSHKATEATYLYEEKNKEFIHVYKKPIHSANSDDGPLTQVNQLPDTLPAKKVVESLVCGSQRYILIHKKKSLESA